MVEENTEAKEVVEEKDPDVALESTMDTFLDQREKDTQEDSSPQENQQEETDETDESTSDPDTAKKEDESKEDDIPDEFHEHEAWKRMKSQRDEAVAKAGELENKDTLSTEDRELLESARLVASSPDFIKSKMKREGFTDEAINAKLTELGHTVVEEGDTLDLVAKRMNIDLSSLDENQKTAVNDIANIAKVIAEDMIAKKIPELIKPIEEGVSSITQKDSATKLTQEIQTTVKDEGILDYKKEVEPALHKWLDENPKANQEDYKQAFTDINHKLVTQRIKVGKKQQDRDEKKSDLRSNVSGGTGAKVSVPDKTGNFDNDADSLLDSLGLPRE